MKSQSQVDKLVDHPYMQRRIIIITLYRQTLTRLTHGFASHPIYTGCGRKRDAALAIYPQQQLPLLYRALRLYPGLRNAIIEAKMRQRLAAEDPTFIVEQQQPLEQSFALPRGDPIY